MREKGLPQVLTWRWTPCAAFVLGSISFAAFMLLAIPDHIGPIPAEATSGSLRFQLARTQAAVTPQSDWSSETTNTASATPRLADHSSTMRNGNGDVSTFPKRGFSPPLERPDPPPAPVAAMPPVPPPQPQLNLPPPVPPQPQLNLPPPVPPPAGQPPPPPPAQPEVLPQAQAMPPPPDAQAAQAPPTN